MTKIADTLFTALNSKSSLAVAALASGDLIPVYDATASAWKVVPAADLGSDAEITAAIGGSTATELDQNDISAMLETIEAGAAVSVTKRITRLNASGGAGSVTLAAPDASTEGMLKIIQYTGGGTNALTLALTNVQGGTAATTASFNADNETLVLIAGKNKWTVLKEVGVTLS